MTTFPRRQFLRGIGATAIVAASNRLGSSWLLASDSDAAATASDLFSGRSFVPVSASTADELLLPDGFGYEVLLRYRDVLNPHGERYGDDNDYLAFVVRNPNEGWLWVNHEGARMCESQEGWSSLSRREQAAVALLDLGGSCVRIARRADGSWRPVVPSAENFRLNGLGTVLELTGPARGSALVGGVNSVRGSVANCGGGVSPWGTFFSAEENFQNYFGDSALGIKPSWVGEEFPVPDTHFGYLVEVDPDTRTFYKHTHLGRMSHENVAFALARDGRLVAYLGDDRQGEHIYKFISRDRYRSGLGKENRRLLNHGVLYAADTVAGRWLPLDPELSPALKRAGFTLDRVCVHTRAAAKVVGATPHARPEDIEVHPVTGEVVVALTRHENQKPGEPLGALGRLREAGGDHGALEFEFSILIAGGRETGLTWPDNLGFTANADLLVTSDYKWSARPKVTSAQAQFGNNHLLLVPTSGARAGQVQRFASAPRGAEFCSPCLSPDRQELWLNVQHPGIADDSEELVGHWPDGGKSLPKSSLVAITRRA